MRRLLPLLLFAAALASAHVVSMSSGELKIDGAKATFELQIPVYETQEIKDPATTLLNQFHFRSAGIEAQILDRSCTGDAATLTCRATYLFNSDVGPGLNVEARLHKVLVVNHVHMLHATMLAGPDAGRSDQAFFDLSFETAELRFRPPSAFETFTRNAASGLWRALSALASLLFLISLVTASRGSLRQLALLSAMFLAGELIAIVFGPRQLPPRFLESAAALTVAYLAIELLLLPNAGQRWLVVALLGAFHGLYFALFLDAGVASKPGFFAGIALGELALVAAIELAHRLFQRLFPGTTLPWTKLVAGSLFATGAIWFIARMIG